MRSLIFRWEKLINFLEGVKNKGVKLATQLSINMLIKKVDKLFPLEYSINERTRYVTDNRLIKSLEIVWASFLIKLEREVDNFITRAITVEKQANGAWRKQLESSATSWTCNFSTWFKKLTKSPFSWSTFIYWTFNFQFLDQVATWSRKLIKKIASVTGA